jgi:hypothetical protein
MQLHKTYHVTGELLAERATPAGREPVRDSILVDLVICGATQEDSAAWYARSVATMDAGYTYAGWLTITVEEIANHDKTMSQ